MTGKKITVYSLSTCGHCRDTINYIARQSVEFSFIDIDLLEKDERKVILREVKKVNPKCTFPTTVIGDHTVIGYDEGELAEALEKNGC